MKKTSPITVKEIARLAGVSIGTVDRVIHGRGRVSPETKERIEQIIAHSGFSPNPIARSLKRKEPYHFVALLPEKSQDSGYWGQLAQGVQNASEEIAVLGIQTTIVEYDRYEVGSFREATQRVVSLHPDGLVLAPILPEESRRFIGSIQEEVPTVYIDADLPGTTPLCAIHQNAFRGGELAGRLALLFSKKSAEETRWGILVPHAEDYHIQQRRNGFLHFASSVRMPVVLKEQVLLEKPEEAQTVLEELICHHPPIDGIFVTNASAHRIAEAVLKIQQKDRFIIIGYDLVPRNHELLLQGAIDAIISQRPETQGRRGLLELYRYVVLGQRIHHHHDIPIDLYLKENAPPLLERGERIEAKLNKEQCYDQP